MELNLTHCDKGNLGGLVLNEISRFTIDVPDDILNYHVDLYNRLTGEQLTNEYCRKHIIEG